MGAGLSDRMGFWKNFLWVTEHRCAYIMCIDVAKLPGAFVRPPLSVWNPSWNLGVSNSFGRPGLCCIIFWVAIIDWCSCPSSVSCEKAKSDGGRPQHAWHLAVPFFFEAGCPSKPHAIALRVPGMAPMWMVSVCQDASDLVGGTTGLGPWSSGCFAKPSPRPKQKSRFRRQARIGQRQ